MINLTEQDRKSYNGRTPPQYLANMLTNIGGTNFFDDPNFRLVWAPERLTPSGGTWVDWPKDSTLKDRRNDRLKPLRRVAEVRMIKRYGPAELWMLEKWCPSSLYGSPKRWYSPAIIGGTMIFIPQEGKYLPSQGSYPSRGDYEYTGFGYTYNELAESTVIQGCQQIIRGIEDLPVSPYERLWSRTMVAEQAQNMVDKNFESWALDVIEDAQPAFGGNTMAGFGQKGISSNDVVARRLKFE